MDETLGQAKGVSEKTVQDVLEMTEKSRPAGGSASPGRSRRIARLAYAVLVLSVVAAAILSLPSWALALVIPSQVRWRRGIGSTKRDRRRDADASFAMRRAIGSLPRHKPPWGA